MITKERLEELIKQEATIYFKEPNRIIDIKLSKSILNYDDEFCLFYNFCNDLKEFYETKEEAEFVSKNHDTRIEKFKPPFELKYKESYIFYSNTHMMCEIFKDNGSYYIYENARSDWKDYKHFDTYQEAVDYAHKLFNGE